MHRGNGARRAHRRTGGRRSGRFARRISRTSQRKSVFKVTANPEEVPARRVLIHRSPNIVGRCRNGICTPAGRRNSVFSITFSRRFINRNVVAGSRVMSDGDTEMPDARSVGGYLKGAVYRRAERHDFEALRTRPVLPFIHARRSTRTAC